MTVRLFTPNVRTGNLGAPSGSVAITDHIAIVSSADAASIMASNPSFVVDRGQTTQSLSLTATTAWQTTAWFASSIAFVRNDGDQPIELQLVNVAGTAQGTMTLKASEVLANVPLAVSGLRYRSTVGTQSFRAMGVD